MQLTVAVALAVTGIEGGKYSMRDRTENAWGFHPYEGMVEYLPAASHGEGYEYRVAFGLDVRDDRTSEAFKINLVAPPVPSRRTGKLLPHGRTMGAEVVAYPTWEDFLAVSAAMERLHARVTAHAAKDDVVH